MKTRLAALAVTLLAGGTLCAAPLAQDTNVHSRPEIAAPVIGRLKAGAEPVRATASIAPTPAGWMAVELPSSVPLFVANGDITKEQDVREGASLLSEPRAGAAVVGTMAKGDRSEVTGFRGRFTEIKVERTFVGYILLGPTPAPAAGATPPPARPPAAEPRAMAIDTSTGLAPRLSEPMPGGAFPAPVSSLGSPVARATPGMAPASLPRTIQGHFASSQRPFTPRRPFDYQINDDAGIRIAYLDLGKARMAELPEKYVGRVVIVTGLAEDSVEARATVITVESLNLR